MIAGIKIKNGSCDPDYAPFRGLFVIPKLGLNIIYLCATFDDSRFNHSRDIIGSAKIENGSRDPDRAPFKGDLSSVCCDLT